MAQILLLLLVIKVGVSFIVGYFTFLKGFLTYSCEMIPKIFFDKILYFLITEQYRAIHNCAFSQGGSTAQK